MNRAAAQPFYRNTWFVISAVILVIAAGIAGFYSFGLKPYVASKIIGGVNKASKGLYKVSFREIHLNLFTGNISFDDLTITPDSIVLSKLMSQKEHPGRTFSLKARGVAFNDISMWETFRKKDLRMRSVLIWKPDLQIEKHRDGKKDGSGKDPYEGISGSLNSLQIGQIILNEANVRMLDTADPGDSLSIRGLTIKAMDLRLDSTVQADPERFLLCRDIQFLLKDHEIKTDDGLYLIRVGTMAASTAARNVSIRQLVVSPTLAEMPFSRKFKARHDRYDMVYPEVTITGLDYPLLESQGKYNASKIKLERFRVDIFMNRELPPVDFDKGRNYPHLILQRLKTRLTIDTVQFSNGLIRYTEYEPKSQKKGTVSFHKFNAKLLNVSNDSLRLKKDHWSRLNVNTRFMNTAPLFVNLNFDLSSEIGAFNFKGNLRDFDMRALNPVSRNLSLAEIESGNVSRADFDVSGDLGTTKGSLKLNYNNLKVTLLKKDEDSGALKEKGLVSTIANLIVIKDRNPNADGTFRIGSTAAVRPASGSFFNLMWRAIFEGLKESIGMKAAAEKTELKPEVDDKRSLRKQKRQENREARRKAREEKKARAKDPAF